MPAPWYRGPRAAHRRRGPRHLAARRPGRGAGDRGRRRAGRGDRVGQDRRRTSSTRSWIAATSAASRSSSCRPRSAPGSRRRTRTSIPSDIRNEIMAASARCPYDAHSSTSRSRSRPRRRTCRSSCGSTSRTPTTRRARRARAADRRRPRACCATRRARRANGCRSARTRRRTSTRRGTTTARSPARPPRRSTSCPSTGSTGPASWSTRARRPTATRSRRRDGAGHRRCRPRSGAPGHRPRPHRPRRLHQRARLHVPRPRRHARGDALAVRAAASASWASTPGAGTRRSTSRPRRRSSATSRASSGPPTSADLPYSQIERLTNLAALPPTGFTVACFPLKIQRASAAPARVVAILEGERMIEDHRGDVLLVGSLPFETAEEAIRAAAEHLGDHLPAFGDGEVGLRKLWIGFLPMTIYSKHPQLEIAARARGRRARRRPTSRGNLRGGLPVRDQAGRGSALRDHQLRARSPSSPTRCSSGCATRASSPRACASRSRSPGTGSAISYFFRRRTGPPLTPRTTTRSAATSS